MTLKAGIDLGGTKIEIAVLDEQSHIVFRERTDTPKHELEDVRYQLIIDAICRLINLAEESLQYKFSAFGIGIPGAVSPKTTLIKNANTTCLIGKSLVNDLSHKTNKRVAIDNDANCFALSEAMDGSGKGANSVFGVILGTGVGGGLVINQQLVCGPNAISGEWGHNPLPWLREDDLPLHECFCGQKGCIETFISGTGFARDSHQRFGLPQDSRTIIAMHQNNHPDATRAYQLFCDRVARSLASIINVIDPATIVLGGGLSNIESIYIDVPKIWGRYVFGGEVDSQLVQHSHGDSSGVRGAAWLTANLPSS